MTLRSVDRFAQALEHWFGRDDTPLWITEYGYEAAPAEPAGVSEDEQAEYAAQALELAAEVPQVSSSSGSRSRTRGQRAGRAASSTPTARAPGVRELHCRSGRVARAPD